ncbi:hypothetical protein [Megamonas hypermegale]|uniref:hypothetical protein n=1 Tax=Megamonas hypermegale TaxID=158847 RepID=UPI0026EF4508|nr:hypothetical protein [Megamonas hypermegale]
MNRLPKDKLADESFFANLKNFILNFIVAVYWLIKSIGKYVCSFFFWTAKEKRTKKKNL